MAYNWNWEEKLGTCTYENGHKCNLYQGNGLMIAIDEREDNTYKVLWFAVDKEHMKNMLGLSKDYDSCWEDFQIKELELDVNRSSTKTIVTLLAQAKAEVTIKLFDSKKDKAPWD